MSETAAEDYTYLTEGEQQLIGELADTVAVHEVRLERLEEKAAAPKTPRGWIQRHQTTTAWKMLADWVDWLNANYSMPHARRVPACWPAHPGLVHVLAGLRSAWRAAVLADEEAEEQGNAMAAFHDYHLFPFFQRLTDIQVYKCGNGHVEDDAHALTQRSFFPEDLEEPETGEVDEEAPEIEPLPEEDPKGDLADDDRWWED